MSRHRHMRLQPLGGIAGDMFVAAMLDAISEFADWVVAVVATVLPREPGEVQFASISKTGIAALQ